MASSDGSIILETKVDDSGLSSGMSKLKSGTKKIGKAFAAAGAAATAAFVAVSKSAVDSYADYEQLVGGVETLFKTSSDTVMNYANQAYQTAGMSANMYMETVTGFSASLLQSLGSDTAKAAEYGNQAVIDMSDNANKMGTDMQRIQDAYQGFAKQNYTMLDNLKLGYGGTKTEMERLLQDAENLKKANGEMASYSIDSFADIVEAIHVVQDNMGITGTTAEEAATTIQGSVGMMKAAWENLLTGLSDTNADVEDLMVKFADSVETVFDNIEPVVEKTLNNLPKLVSNLGTKLIKEIPQIVSKVAPKVLSAVADLLEAIVSTIEKKVDLIVDTVINIGKMLIQTIASLIPQMVSAGVKIIKALVQGIQAELPVLSTAALAITAVFTAIKITSFVQGIVSGFNAVNAVLNAYTAACATSESVSILLASTMTPLQLAIGVLTGKVSLATVAQTAWNAVMNLNPAILITTAVVGLTTAVVGAVSAYGSYVEKHSEVVQATKAMADASAEAAEKAQEHAEKMAKLGETATQTIEDAEAEAYANSILADELYNLAEQTELTAEQKERMRDIVDELNGNIDGLNLQLDEETGQLNLTRDAMDEYITKSLEVAKAKAVQELYTESLKEQYKAQSQMKQAAEDYMKAQEELNKYIVDGKDYTQSYSAQGQEARKAMKNLREVIENSTQSFNTNMVACQNSQDELQGIADVAGVELPQGFEIALQSFDGMAQGMIDKCQETSDQSSGLGQDFGAGYASGIGDKNSEVYQKAYNLALQALRGIRDGQNSASPAKETIKLGDYFDEGYIIGIENGFDDVEKTGETLAKKALNGAKAGTKEVATGITNALKSLTDDTRTEVQKLYDEWEDDVFGLTAQEEWYAFESARIESEREKASWKKKIDAVEEDYRLEKEKAKNSEEIQEAENKRTEKLEEIHNERMEKEQERAEDEYLAGLKSTAEKARQLREAEAKDAENLKNKIIDTYNEMSENAISEIDALQKTQESFANKLKSYGNLYNERETSYGTYKSLADIGKTNQTLEDYYDTLMKVKERGDVPAEFFENLRDMGVDEGLEYAKSLLKLNDKQWDKYIADWEKKQEISERISKDIYKDEAEELATEINSKFEAVEDEFFGVGETSADEFESGFLSELESVIANIKRTINGAFSGVAIPVGSLQSSGIVTQSATLNVPAMAKGGVVPRAMAAIIGERGREAVLPLENNTEWMDVLADKVAQRSGGQTNQVVREEHYNLNQTELMTIMYKLVKGGERLNGTSLINGGAY